MDSQENSQRNFDLDQLAAEMEQTPAEENKPRRIGLIVAGVVGLIVLLGAAAFVAFRLVGQGPVVMGPGGGPGQASFVLSGPGGQSRSFSISVTPAPELPTTPVELSGIYARQEGNSLFVHQMVEGAFDPANNNKGPEVEVVITEDTKIYKDATSLPDPGEMQETNSMQQVVEQVDGLDGLSSETFFRIWGERRGDRVIATAILYSEPVIRMVPAAPAN